MTDERRSEKRGTTLIDGVVPVMLTPFCEDGSVDWPSLARLTDWYIANGAGALFAVCQSSEMQHLSLRERTGIARFVADHVGKRVPVIASGHIAETIEEQAVELGAMAASGIDGLVLVTNRLDPDRRGGGALLDNLGRLLDRLPRDLPLGLYECPAPFRRLLSDEEFELCLATGRFVVLKDVSCDLGTIRRRVALARQSGFAVINANAAIAFDAMRAGSSGFAGVFTNFHPDLYAWLYANRSRSDTLVDELARFLALSAVAETMGYPALAKLHHRRLGTFSSVACRSIPGDIHEKFWAVEALLDHIAAGAEAFRLRIAAAGSDPSLRPSRQFGGGDG